MKKLILVAIMTFVVVTIYGQSFEKGNLVSIHVMTITLSPNVTMDEYLDFFINKIIPEEEKYFEVKEYILKGILGECKNCVGFMVVWPTEAVRNKYFRPEGGFNELGAATNAKMKSIKDEWRKLGTYTSKFTDWAVQ